MVTPSTLIKATFDSSKAFFGPSVTPNPTANPGQPGGSAPSGRPGGAYVHPVMVPIRSIGPSHSERIAAHLLSLSAHDRYLRFGYAANDEQILRYVNGIDYERDEVFGIYNRKLQLIAMAHLAFSTDPQLKSCAEFGVSVLAKARGRRYGSRLFDRAIIHARNNGVEMMFIHALSENMAMLNIARKAGATIQREGSESEAFLVLPPADLDSRMTEIVEEQIAQTDYRFKFQAKQFWELLALMRQARYDLRRDAASEAETDTQTSGSPRTGA